MPHPVHTAAAAAAVDSAQQATSVQVEHVEKFYP